ncbi:hypothetical protein BDZ89DRAFT_1062860 [Hymenopellis radicata]|nr:hypothetical protein BDZ89DRAFT_1062860 [Hymenopellis radicata]
MNPSQPQITSREGRMGYMGSLNRSRLRMLLSSPRDCDISAVVGAHRRSPALDSPSTFPFSPILLSIPLHVQLRGTLFLPPALIANPRLQAPT